MLNLQNAERIFAYELVVVVLLKKTKIVLSLEEYSKNQSIFFTEYSEIKSIGSQDLLVAAWPN